VTTESFQATGFVTAYCTQQCCNRV